MSAGGAGSRGWPGWCAGWPAVSEPRPSALDKLEGRFGKRPERIYSGLDDELGDYLRLMPERPVGRAVDDAERRCALCGEPGANETTGAVWLHATLDEHGWLGVAPWLSVTCWEAWTAYGYRPRHLGRHAE